jgi:hypothetical protein
VGVEPRSFSDRRKIVRRAPIAVLLLTLGACATQASTSTEPGPSFEDFLGYMRQFNNDYEPADTPTNLAEEAEAVVLGDIVDVSPGQSYAPSADAEAEIATSVLEVRVQELFKGDPAVVANDSVYVEVPHPAFVGLGPEEGGPRVPFDYAAFASTVPRTRALFFLDDRTTEPYWKTIINEGAGRPVGAHITAPFTQGFLIENGGELVSVMEPLSSMPPGWHDISTLEELLTDVIHGLGASGRRSASEVPG